MLVVSAISLRVSGFRPVMPFLKKRILSADNFACNFQDCLGALIERFDKPGSVLKMVPDKITVFFRAYSTLDMCIVVCVDENPW